MDVDNDSNDTGDVVRWQSSQSSCAALEALLAQSSRSTVQKTSHHLTIWDAPRPYLAGIPGAIALEDEQPPTTRPKSRPPANRQNARRTSTSLRRSTSPVVPDHSTLIALIPGVSAKVDENAHRKTRYLTRRRPPAPAPDPTKPQTRTSSGTMSSRSTFPDFPRTTRPHPIIGRKSLPEFTSHSDITMDTDADDNPNLKSFLSTNPPPTRQTHSEPSSTRSSQSRMPPPPVPVSTPAKPPHHSQSHSPAKIHPAPTSTQTRPPPLGMRRSITYTSVPASQTALPDKRKPFKPPLARPQSPSPRSTQPTRRSPPPKRPRPPPRSPSPPADPDSSFGEISFDRDALEETMKQYD